MSTLLEMGRRRRNPVDRDEELKPIIPAFDDPSVDLPSDDMAAGMNMLHQLFQVGEQRKKELEALMGEEDRTGEWWIPHAINGQYSDFEEQANYKYFKDTYPWLTASGDRIGIDTTKAVDNYPDLESFLASIPHDSWQSFITDMEEMTDPDSDAWIYKNEDLANELRQEEEARWMKEDGWPELVKAMRDSAPDAYDGYLLSKVPQDLVWEWCGESGNYPEAQGDGSVWLDMDGLGERPETREWFLDHVNEDEEGWNAIKIHAYNNVGLVAMDRALKELAAKDTDIAYVYNQLTDDDLWKLFLESFPDEPRHEGDPGWYWFRPDYFYREEEQEGWRPGFKPPESSPRSVPKGWALTSTMNAFTYLSEQPWWLTMLRNWKRRPPEGHPELEFESLEADDPALYVDRLGDKWVMAYTNPAGLGTFYLGKRGNTYGWFGNQASAVKFSSADEALKTWTTVAREKDIVWDRSRFKALPDFNEALEAQPDPDDPEVFMRHGGGLREELLYDDDKIQVFYSNDLQSINWHLRRAGRPEMQPAQFAKLKYGDIFIIVGKEPADLLGRDGKRELGIVYGDGTSDLTAWYSTSADKMDLATLLADPTYGRSIKRALLKYYRERGEDTGHAFLQIGGPRALRRAGERGQIDISRWTTTLGLRYVKSGKYKLAAKAFGRDPKTLTPDGVYLQFENVNELAEVFENPKAATEVFDHEIYHWFDGYPMPEVKEVTEFLTPKAIQHIRKVMVNREVWYPDAGPDGQGANVILTTALLNEVDDDTIIEWLENPDEQDGNVFEDIRDAIQQAGFRMIESVGTDEYFTSYVKAAIGTFDGTEYKWVDHPRKKGADVFQVFATWRGIEDAAEKYEENYNERWSGDLEQLVLYAYRHSIEGPDVQPSMWDVKDALKKSPGWVEDFMEPIYELEPPEAPENPNQMPLPIPEGLDDPEAMPDMLSGVPHELPKLLKKDLESFTRSWGVTISDFKVEFEYDPARYGSLLKVSFKPEGAWIHREGVLVAHGWDSVCSYLTHHVVNAYTDEWAVMDGYFSEDAPPGYVWMIWPLHKRNDPDIPL